MNEYIFDFQSNIGELFHECLRGEHLVALEASINGNYRDQTPISFVNHLIDVTCYRINSSNKRVSIGVSKLTQDDINTFAKLFVYIQKDGYFLDDTPLANESDVDFIHRYFSEGQEMLRRAFERGYARIKSTWTDAAAKYGWYPCPEMPERIKKSALESQNDTDRLMIGRVEKNLEQTLDHIVSNSISRKHIIEIAFRLHKSENYIASIPLLLAQAEGIFESTFRKRFYSRNGGRSVEIEKIIKRNLGDGFNAFLSASLVISPFMAKEKNQKRYGPNRNGILHGDERHLDYGTCVNSCKAITLLAYTSWMAEIFKNIK